MAGIKGKTGGMSSVRRKQMFIRASGLTGGRRLPDECVRRV